MRDPACSEERRPRERRVGGVDMYVREVDARMVSHRQNHQQTSKKIDRFQAHARIRGTNRSICMSHNVCGLERRRHRCRVCQFLLTPSIPSVGRAYYALKPIASTLLTIFLRNLRVTYGLDLERGRL